MYIKRKKRNDETVIDMAICPIIESVITLNPLYFLG